jgi:hypothetical protein
MEEKDENLPEEKFSDDPQENLRIENEILKLKMKAESGAYFCGSNKLPPEIENEFLLNVQQLEDAWKDVKYVKVYDLVGKPDFKKARESSDSEVKDGLEKLLHLLNEHNINLAVHGEYEPRIIYRFITEELFEHETDDLQLPGMSKNFIYEEFHPNHKTDIEECARNFLNHWFEKNFDEHSSELNDPFILSDGTIINKEKVLKKMNDVFASFTSFTNCQFTDIETGFEWDEEEKRGIGHAEGGVRYDAVMGNGETIHFEGPFKLYMSSEDYYWGIFYFVFPGFRW